MSTTITAIERMVRTVIPDFVSSAQPNSNALPFRTLQGQSTTVPYSSDNLETNLPAFALPSMPFAPAGYGRNEDGRTLEMIADEQGDFAAADVGLGFDFSTMDMEAFLALDSTQDAEFWNLGLEQ